MVLFYTYFRTETDEFNEEGSASATIVRWESLKAKEHLQKSEDVWKKEEEITRNTLSAAKPKNRKWSVWTLENISKGKKKIQ